MTFRSRTVAITRGPEDAAEFHRYCRVRGWPGLGAAQRYGWCAGQRSISNVYMRECGAYDPDYTVLMSSKAVRLLMDDAKQNGRYDAVRLAMANTLVVAVGPKTAAALEEYGVKVNLMPESVYSSVGVGEVMSRMDRSKNRVLVPRSGASKPFLRSLLEKEGFDVRETYLYDVEPHPGGPVWDEFGAMLAAGMMDGMVFTSASSVRAFFDIVGDVSASLEGVAVVCIGPFTAEELERFGVAHDVAEVHTVSGSLDALRIMLK